MKLYAVREKETGKLVIEDPKREEWALSKRFGDLWVEDNPEEMESFAKEVSADLNTTLEVVTLRIEPTEPCLWCKDTILGQVDRLIPYETWPGETEYEPDTLFAQNWQFCPNCGRRLGDDHNED